MRHFLLLSSLLALAACSDDNKTSPNEPKGSQPGENAQESICGDGAAVSYDGLDFCVYEGAIHETGFRCPERASYNQNGYSYGQARVCSSGACNASQVAGAVGHRSLRSPETSALKEECTALRQVGSKLLGGWPSRDEIILLSFKEIAPGRPIPEPFAYSGPATIDSLRTEVWGGNNETLSFAAVTAGDFVMEFVFDPADPVFSQRLTEGATFWISFHVLNGFIHTVEDWTLKSAEDGDLWAMSVDKNWNWIFGEGEEDHWPPNDIQGHVIPDLSQIEPLFEAEGFGIALEALDDEEVCDVSPIDCLDGPGHFLPVTLSVDGKTYKHLYGRDAFERDGARYRLDVIEASTEAGTSGAMFECRDVPAGNHLHLLIALDE